MTRSEADERRSASVVLDTETAAAARAASAARAAPAIHARAFSPDGARGFPPGVIAQDHPLSPGGRRSASASSSSDAPIASKGDRTMGWDSVILMVLLGAIILFVLLGRGRPRSAGGG
jgi:hypothetical protein